MHAMIDLCIFHVNIFCVLHDLYFVFLYFDIGESATWVLPGSERTSWCMTQ